MNIKSPLIALVILFSMIIISVAYASSWSTAEKITNGNAKLDDIFMPSTASLAVENGKIYVIYTKRRSANDEMFEPENLFLKTKNNGVWSRPIRIATNASGDGDATLSLNVKNGKMYIFYDGYKSNPSSNGVYFLTNKNGSWVNKRLTASTTEFTLGSTFKTDRYIYLTYHNGSEVYFRRYLINENTFTKDKLVFTSNGSVNSPNIAVSNRNLFLVWTEWIDGIWDDDLGYSIGDEINIKYKRRFRDGKWTAAQTITKSSNVFDHRYEKPRVFVINGSPRIIYEKMEFDSIALTKQLIYFSRKIDGKWNNKIIARNAYQAKPLLRNNKFEIYFNKNWSEIFSLSNKTGTWAQTNITATNTQKGDLNDFFIDELGKHHLIYTVFDSTVVPPTPVYYMEKAP